MPSWLSWLLTPWLDWIQVEVTTHCNAHCVYCPVTLLRDKWRGRHLSREMFSRLIPVFRRARLVYLQGWGEPLLHPDFFEMARMAHYCGCHVGVTTNGILLNDIKASRMVDAGIHFVAFSLAGTNNAQDTIRVGTSLEGVLHAISRLTEAKSRAGSKFPIIHVAYLALRSRLQDVRELPNLLEGLGVAEVIISSLDYVLDPKLETEVIRPQTREEAEQLRELFSRVAREGRRRNLRVYARFPSVDELLGPCPENVGRAAVVSAAGEVFPCVFLNQPNPRSGDYYSMLGPRGFGNIGELSFADIWRSTPYRSFRQAHEKGLYPSLCQGCPKLSLQDYY